MKILAGFATDGAICADVLREICRDLQHVVEKYVGRVVGPYIQIERAAVAEIERLTDVHDRRASRRIQRRSSLRRKRVAPHPSVRVGHPHAAIPGDRRKIRLPQRMRRDRLQRTRRVRCGARSRTEYAGRRTTAGDDRCCGDIHRTAGDDQHEYRATAPDEMQHLLSFLEKQSAAQCRYRARADDLTMGKRIRYAKQRTLQTSGTPTATHRILG